MLRVGGEEPEERVAVQVHQLNVVCRDVDLGNGDCRVVLILYAQLLQHREQGPALAGPGSICKRGAGVRLSRQGTPGKGTPGLLKNSSVNFESGPGAQPSGKTSGSSFNPEGNETLPSVPP